MTEGDMDEGYLNALVAENEVHRRRRVPARDFDYDAEDFMRRADHLLDRLESQVVRSKRAAAEHGLAFGLDERKGLERVQREGGARQRARAARLLLIHDVAHGNEPVELATSAVGAIVKKTAKRKPVAKKTAKRKPAAKKTAKRKPAAKKTAKRKSNRATKQASRLPDLRGATFLFTGKLGSGFTRAEAEGLVRKAGGKVVGHVSRDLDYLVVGDAGSERYGVDNKLAKVLRLRDKGVDVEVMNERRFLALFGITYDTF